MHEEVGKITFTPKNYDLLTFQNRNLSNLSSYNKIIEKIWVNFRFSYVPQRIMDLKASNYPVNHNQYSVEMKCFRGDLEV